MISFDPSRFKTSRATVDFVKKFSIPGIDGEFPPGAYQVDTDEEMIDGLSFIAWRKIGVVISVVRGSVTQAHFMQTADYDLIRAEDTF